MSLRIMPQYLTGLPSTVRVPAFVIPTFLTLHLAMDWSAELFDIGQAGTYANQNQSDYWPSISLASPSPSAASSSSGSSIDIGTIIGGAVGGAAGLLIILVRCYFLRKRRQYRRLHNVDGTIPIPYTGIPMTNIPARWSSDPNNFTLAPPSSPRMSYLATQPEGTNAGMNTFPPPPVYSSVQAISLPPADTTSFLTTENTAAQRSQAIPMV
ncbi:hypothetical protein J3R82DRAFT_10101 [Butyriboletus roseoflavus]|nr:hypothetical protein J3R82DRAFT_10101 [Butyriboletus roseoflavus]